ncbi:suppressor of G2 allele of SKP1 [Fistulifera solaris]|uniref:Suppressor of G2 allele of SKP1 n=1 Tax=Fistulifera solaris TaxID=1519565 RepID=A0A1Z5KH73_FISSO|nr:suppressor of G2 allele of SKP1 [Fistulifera solaris]|eukprot:GAX25318.1 suppressor of G2 allele of SKP1 [Fistulifera solaris]
MSEAELPLTDMTAEECLAMADSYAVDENWDEALTVYTAALTIWHTNTAVKFRILSHRSNCFYQLGNYESAQEDAHEATQLLSSSVAGLRPGESEVAWKRQGLAAFQANKFADAKQAFESAAQLASLNQRDGKSYRDWIQKCDTKLNPPAIAPSPATTDEPLKAQTAPTSAPVSLRSATKAAIVAAPRYQYYQSDKFMTISILEPNLNSEHVKVDFERQRLYVTIVKAGKEFQLIAGPLYDEIDPSESKIQYKPEKVLLKLRKVNEYEWKELMGNESKKGTASTTKSATQPKVRPYASPKDWGTIEKSIQAEEEKETPQGDDAMNKLFQQIYANADEDTRRAMIKSYQTSGGTVLSTNWDEVSKKDYEKERTAPKGMEWKTWEGDKVPMEED